MNLLPQAGLVGGVMLVGSAVVRIVTEGDVGGGGALNLVIAIVGAVGVLGAAAITALIARRKEPDSLPENIYHDLRQDAATAQLQRDVAVSRVDELEDFIRASGLVVPHDDG